MLLWILENEFEMGLEKGPLRDMQYNTTCIFRVSVNFVISIDVMKQNKMS